MFLIYIGVMIYAGLSLRYVYVNGDIGRLINFVDSDLKPCGVGDRKDFPLLFHMVFPEIKMEFHTLELGYSVNLQSICVK